MAWANAETQPGQLDVGEGGVQPEGTVGTEVRRERSWNVRGPKLQQSERRSGPLHHVALSGPGLRWLLPQSKGSDLPNCALKPQPAAAMENG